MKVLSKLFYFLLLFSIMSVSNLFAACDSSLDTSANDSSPGVAITGMDGADSNVSKCIKGESVDGNAHAKDYYYFTVNTAGTLKITTSSPNDHKYHLKIGSTEKGDEYYPNQTAKSHNIPDIHLKAGDSVYLFLKETGSGTDKYKLQFNFEELIIENADDLCYEKRINSGLCVDMSICSGGWNCKKTYPLKNIGSDSLDDVVVNYDETGLGGTFGSNCGVNPSGSCSTENNVDMGPAGMLGSTTEFNLTNSIPVGDNSNQVWTKNFVGMSCFNGEKLYTTYMKDGVKHRGKVNACPPSYCEEHGLSEGFHIIDPDGGDDENSYEIYCDMNSANAPRELIALPIKNDYNNFVFKDDHPNSNYYAEADAAKADDAKNEFSFLQINIKGSDVSIVPSSVAKGSSKNEGYFSNINLIGTPFAIDWDHTSLSNCDTSKLRIGAFNQAVKINTLDYTKGRCKVNSIRLKLLDNYKYLTYDDVEGTDGSYGDEILEETCRQIFEKVPDDSDHLATENNVSDGYFWIDPDKGGRDSADTLTTTFRPFVAYCKYQRDINQAWTFVMALDGKVTNSKNDIHTMEEVKADPTIYHDTCSQLGLLFFVPNTKDTFTRTQSYLKTNKPQWINYTGTIREKYKMYKNNPSQEYYIKGEGYNEIWPYGPFGLYFPENGKQSGGENWYGGDHTKTAYMSGRCMNSGSASGAETCTDYAPKAKYTAIPNDDNTMGIAGWRTTLRDMVEDTSHPLLGITDGEQFWIADVGAGTHIRLTVDNKECSVTSPSSNPANCNYIYYEPNGNYTKEAWLNFIADSNGNVYHNDDNNAFYSYYDYMCMAWDNYYGFDRYGLTNGPFTVIKHDPSLSGTEPFPAPSDTNISTTVVNENTNFDVLLLNNNKTQIIDDQNISAGIFLTSIEEIEVDGHKQNKLTDLHYYGQIGAGDDFDLVANPRGILSLNNDSPYPLVKMPKAHQRLVFQFKYCGYGGALWNSCWQTNGSGANLTATCKTGYDTFGKPRSPCKIAESDDFALRPKKFSLSSLDGVLTGTTLVVQAKDVNISYRADDFDGNPTNDYNVSFDQLNTDIALVDSGLSCSTSYLNDTNQSTYKFEDGLDAHTYTLSDVGIYNFTLEEIDGQEFAKVDADDTNWSDRQIEPNTITLTIKPDHFKVTSIPNLNHNTDGDFSYLSNDLEHMAAKLDFNVTAENSSNATTLNYTSTCYAADFNLDVNFTTPLGTAINTMNYVVKDKNNNSIAIAHNSSPTSDGAFIKHGDKISKVLFTNDVNGTAKVVVKFNFTRAINTAVNPFTINLNNINVSDTTTPLVVNTQNQNLDNNATFVYGRVAGPKRAGFTNCVDNQTNCISQDNSPRMVFQIYKDQFGSVVPALNGATHDGTQDSRWWTSPFHDKHDGVYTQQDGNITTPTHSTITEIAGGHVTQNSLVAESNFRYKAQLHYDGQDGYVKEAHLKHYPSSWLIYDKNNAAATYNTFNFNFITEGWSGKHESSAAGKTDAAHRTSKRIIW